MNRRDLFKLLLIPFIPKPSVPLYRPSFCYFSGEDVTFGRVPLSMMGIPYHQSDATTGQWLGIERK